MTDLANLLGDVYSGPGPAATPVRREPHPEGRPEVPAWADDSKLDEVFADWNPGPAPDAPTVERNLMSLVPPAPAPPRALDDDLAAALSAALVEANNAYVEVSPRSAPPAAAPGGVVVPPIAPPAVSPPAPAAAPSAAPAATWNGPATVMAPASVAVTPAREWEPGDDDIVPATGKGDRRRRWGRRR